MDNKKKKGRFHDSLNVMVRWLNRITSPEGCTAVDAQKLREYNHGLADEIERYRDALRSLYDGQNGPPLLRYESDPIGCPFCGNKNLTYFSGWKFGSRKKDDSDFRKPSIYCECCSFSIGSLGRGISDEDAYAETVKAWNRRVTPNDLHHLRETNKGHR